MFLLVFISLSVVAAVASVVMTRLTGEMGRASADLNVASLAAFLGILSAVMTVRAVSSAVAALLLGRFSGRVGYSFRENFVDYFLRVPFSQLEKTGSGEVMSIYSNDLPGAVGFASADVLHMIADALTLIAAGVLMVLIHPLYTLIFFALFPLLTKIQVEVSKRVGKYYVAVLESMGNFNSVVNDSLQNTSTIMAYSLENVLEKRCAEAYKQVFDASAKQVKAYMPLMLAGILGSLLPVAFITIVSAFAVINGAMDIAEYIAYIGIATIAGTWLAALSQQLNNVRTSMAGAKRVADNTSYQLEAVNTEKLMQPVRSEKQMPVSFRDVSFSYDENQTNVLNKISFDIAPNSRVALVGGSGSGKSTILKLLLKFYDTNEGTISIGGKSIDEMNISELRNNIAYVPQDSFLLPATIAENIAANPKYNEQRLAKACTDAGVLDFIESLPDKHNSILSESAENVSGGQRQRIAMARAFYKDAPIILFDETTSALDPATEKAVLENLIAATKHKTVIMVAHRLSAITICDTVVFLENGQVSGVGSHKELTEKNAAYRKLYEARRSEAHDAEQ